VTIWSLLGETPRSALFGTSSDWTRSPSSPQLVEHDLRGDAEGAVDLVVVEHHRIGAVGNGGDATAGRATGR
jgi:hypothetical protein